MSLYQVILLPSAKVDLDEAYSWIAEQNEEAAHQWFNGALDLVETLETFPERCSLAPESVFFSREIRQIFYGRRQHKYRILFTIQDRKVFVLHVRHGARLIIGDPDDLN